MSIRCVTRVVLSMVVLMMAASCACAQDDANESFVSPDKHYRIVFKGAYRGEGAYFIETGNGELEILRRKVYYGPQFKWVTNKIAELTFGCGSPCWDNYYYDASEHKLSPAYSMALAISPGANLVAVIEEKGLAIREIFTGTMVAMQEMDTAVWAGLLTFCDPEFKFVGDREFRYSYTCGKLEFGPYAPGNGVQRILLKKKPGPDSQ